MSMDTLLLVEKSKADLILPSNKIMFQHKIQTGQDNKMITNAYKYPRAIILIKNMNLELNKDKPRILVDKTLMDELKKNVLDMITYGRAATQFCNLFKEHHEDFARNQYLPRE